MILWKLLVLLNVLKNVFNTYFDWFFSWFLNLDLDYPWILILETWFLNLKSWFLRTWFLNLWNFLNSWFFSIIKITLEDIASISFSCLIFQVAWYLDLPTLLQSMKVLAIGWSTFYFCWTTGSSFHFLGMIRGSSSSVSLISLNFWAFVAFSAICLWLFLTEVVCGRVLWDWTGWEGLDSSCLFFFFFFLFLGLLPSLDISLMLSKDPLNPFSEFKGLQSFVFISHSFG